ncbi:hypothetical protein COO60DRAFT_792551 [Scenedesmus sp. NREL 46B-D3]|nr:hypothetical protein COO60DRAFT_792551 [Scenedesmus sp. NREL 46B-D3]
MACAAWPSKEHDYIDLASEDLLDLPLPPAAAAARLVDGSHAQANLDISEMVTAATQAGLGPLQDFIFCDSPGHTGAAALEQQQQQQCLPAVAVGVQPVQGLHGAAAARTPYTAKQATDAARLDSSFIRGYAAAAAPTASASVAYTTMDSAAYAATAAVPAAPLRRAAAEAFTQQEPHSEAEEEEEQQQQGGRQQRREQQARGRKKTQKRELSPAQLAARKAAWQRKLQQLSPVDAALFPELNLPKATLTKLRQAELAAYGIHGEPGASRYYYMARGPQLTLRGTVRRITALFPAAYNAFLEICQARELSAEGAQLDLKACEEFFVRVLAPPGLGPEAADAYMPAMEERRPLRELDYVAGVVSQVAGRKVTASQVNACFIPGSHNYEVDYSKLAQLGITAAEVTLPFGAPSGQGVQMSSGSASNNSGSSAWPAAHAAAACGLAAAAARLGKGQQGTKRRGVASTSNGLKKQREAAAVLARSAALQLGVVAAAAAAPVSTNDSVATATAAAPAFAIPDDCAALVEV